MAAPAPTSLIDVVDERDRPVSTIERGRVLEEGKAFRVAHVWVFHQDSLLLQQLARHRRRHPLQWGSSVAAYLHAGETYSEAAERRLREELGLELTLRPYAVTRMRDEASLKFVALYLATAPRPDLPEIREPRHIENLRYWSRAEVEHALAARPETLTETFRHLYSVYTGQADAEGVLH